MKLNKELSNLMAYLNILILCKDESIDKCLRNIKFIYKLITYEW